MVRIEGMKARAASLVAALFCVFLSGCLSGCATAPGETSDPLEPVNRVVFNFNKALDRHAALPAASFYRNAIPGPMRSGVHNFLANLGEPVTFGNDVLQGDFTNAERSAERFALNTTLGVGGVLDVATERGLYARPEDFGITLGKYGIPSGPYFVLPLAGPETVRDFGGRFADSFMIPTRYFTYAGKAEVSLLMTGLGALDQRSQNVSILRDIERNSVDYYATTRSLYLQSRESRIHNGEPVPENLPAF